ncbi:helix-turn-helix transcriptional regulator [Motiliproteus sp. SC1-56]|uniref:helix-turn-helix domain-containing protein n=1 Tax=Motiliproteus sp. SC1-56 TaxID=2799565 RepID=UPI001F5D8F6D|nr:helix-turn-helix transcriptional regulator [Motiliproteus sp. SC1-56]
MIRFKLKELTAEKAFREGRRINLQEIAEQTGVHRTTLSKLQSPTGHNTTTENLNALCKYFDCAIQDLIEYVPDEP